ncbi:hypothetical protein GCM10010519_76870 [Streptomyces lactacystinicus]
MSVKKSRTSRKSNTPKKPGRPVSTGERPVLRQWAAWQREIVSAAKDRRAKVRKENLPALRQAQRGLATARANEAKAKADYDRAAAPATGERAVWKAAAKETRAAQRVMAEARKQVPASAWTLGAGAVAVPGVAAEWLSGGQWESLLVAYPAASAVAAAGSYGWWRVRHYTPPVKPKVADGIVPTPAELALLARLEPEHWAAHRDARGLKDTITARPELSQSGIRCAVRLDGTWTPEKLAGAEGNVRALLGVARGVRIQIGEGDHGGWASIVLRTRSAADGASMLWTPNSAGIGLDTATGQPVLAPPARMLIAGTSGAGKSVLLRSVMAPTLFAQEPTALIYIDAKGEEAALWDGSGRTAIDPPEIAEVCAELAAENRDRRDAMRAAKKATWKPTLERPRLLVVVDEGAEVISLDSRKLPILEPLRTIGRTGRSRRIDLVWCTQKPTVGDGIDRQILGVLEDRICLRTAGRVETQTVLGEGWAAHHLPGVGLAYVKAGGRGPDQAPVRAWDFSEDHRVTALPKRTAWQHSAAPARPAAPAPVVEWVPGQRPALSLVKGDDFDDAEESVYLPTPAAPAPNPPADRREAVKSAILGGARTTDQIAKATGIPASTAGRIAKQLREAGEVSA